MSLPKQPAKASGQYVISSVRLLCCDFEKTTSLPQKSVITNLGTLILNREDICHRSKRFHYNNEVCDVGHKEQGLQTRLIVLNSSVLAA